MFWSDIYVHKRAEDQRQLTLRRPGHILEQQRYDGPFQQKSKGRLPFTEVRFTILLRYTAYEDLWMNACKKTAQNPKTYYFGAKKRRKHLQERLNCIFNRFRKKVTDSNIKKKKFLYITAETN